MAMIQRTIMKEMKFEHGYIQLKYPNLFRCQFAYLEAKYHALAADSDDYWYGTALALYRAKIPAQFHDEEYGVPDVHVKHGVELVIVTCTVPRRQRKAFIKIMEERDAHMRQEFEDAYTETIATIGEALEEVQR